MIFNLYFYKIILHRFKLIKDTSKYIGKYRYITNINNLLFHKRIGTTIFTVLKGSSKITKIKWD